MGLGWDIEGLVALPEWLPWSFVVPAVTTVGALLAALLLGQLKRPREAPRDPSAWIVTRCAAWSAERRQVAEKKLGKNWQCGKGLSLTPPRKPAVASLGASLDGVYCCESSGLWSWGEQKHVKDANHFRQQGMQSTDDCPGFSQGTNDRAVSLSTVDAYDAIRLQLPGVKVLDGDLGENIILDGPQFQAGNGLDVGTVLRIGQSLEIQLTEVNKPCYRMQYVPWSAAAALRWTNVKEITKSSWRKDPSCPLSQPGGRGWLAKVLVEGEIKPGDQCIVVGGETAPWHSPLSSPSPRRPSAADLRAQRFPRRNELTTSKPVPIEVSSPLPVKAPQAETVLAFLKGSGKSDDVPMERRRLDFKPSLQPCLGLSPQPSRAGASFALKVETSLPKVQDLSGLDSPEMAQTRNELAELEKQLADVQARKKVAAKAAAAARHQANVLEASPPPSPSVRTPSSKSPTSPRRRACIAEDSDELEFCP